jgi:hypothetical protein
VMRRVEHVEFELREFYVSPVGSISRWRHVVVGDGYRIPEPTTSSLLLLAVITVSCHRLRRSYRRLGSCRNVGC